MLETWFKTLKRSINYLHLAKRQKLNNRFIIVLTSSKSLKNLKSILAIQIVRSFLKDGELKSKLLIQFQDLINNQHLLEEPITIQQINH